MKERSEKTSDNDYTLTWDDLHPGDVYATDDDEPMIATDENSVVELDGGFIYDRGGHEDWRFRHLPHATFSRGE